MDYTHSDYTVAWVCALPLEMTAAKAMLEKVHLSLPQPETDHNTYILGSIANHNVVVACLPSGVYGTTSAATVLAHMLSTFRSLRFGLMVGVGGGVPSDNADIRLGDVVVSIPTPASGGVIQYDYGKTLRDGRLHRTGSLNKPPQCLLTAVSHMRSDSMIGASLIQPSISEMLQKQQKIYKQLSKPDRDWLFHSGYDHVSAVADCSLCDQSHRVVRTARVTNEPAIHYGLIACGNQVIKNAKTRDSIAQGLNILCFEMEAAGLMDQLPCLVIRGVCDYCDSHKNKDWQGYAALTAAVYAGALLAIVPSINNKAQQDQKTKFTAEEKACLQGLFITDPADDRSALQRRKGKRAPGTCNWILETNELNTWLRHHEGSESRSNVLWLYGNPGTGKSTMAITLTEELPKKSHFAGNNVFLAYFFCDSSSEAHRTALSILRGLLYQLITERPELIKYLLSKYNTKDTHLFSSFDALWSVLMSLSNDKDIKGIYCIIDALDECDHESQRMILEQIDQTFTARHMKDDSSSKLHLLITSRPFPEIRQYLSSFESKDLASYREVSRDLEKMIREKVENLRSKKSYSQAVAADVSRILEDKAEGTFLWVGIACDELAQVQSRNALKILHSLPRGLHSLYQKLLDRAIESDDRNDQEIIIDMLSFVTVSRRRMTLTELCEACQIYPNADEESRLQFTREYIDLCRLMVVISGEHVQLLHKSVRDFLVRHTQRIDDIGANSTLAYRCINSVLHGYQSGGNKTRSRTEQEFLDYSTIYWTEHASVSESRFTVAPEHECFFSSQSDSWGTWLKQYNSLRDDFQPQLDASYSALHVAAKWGIVNLAAYVLTKTKGVEVDDTAYKASGGLTPMEEAIRRGHMSVISLLWEQGSAKRPVSARVLTDVLLNGKNKQEVLAFLLNRGSEVQITEDLVKTMHRDWRNGAETMQDLLRKDSIQITGSTVAVICELFGSNTVKMLLEHENIQIETNAVRAAIHNRRDRTDVVKLLLSRRGDRIPIAEETLALICRNFNSNILKLLLDRQEHLPITEYVVKSAAANTQSSAAVKLLLDRLGNRSVPITESLLKVAAANGRFGAQLLETILGRSNIPVKITEKVLKAAAANEESGKQVMEFLLDRDDQVRISSDVLKSAAANWGNGKEVIGLLSDRRQIHLPIPENVFRVAAYNPFHGKEVIRLLVEFRESCTEYTNNKFKHPEDAVEAAAGDWKSGKQDIQQLLNRGDRILITEGVVHSASTNWGSGRDVMELLLSGQEAQVSITREAVLLIYAKFDSKIVALLLHRQGKQFQLTEDVLKAAASNCSNGRQVMELLLSQKSGLVLVTKDLVETIALNFWGGKDVIDLLLGQQEHQLHITQEAMAFICTRFGPKTIALLSSRLQKPIQFAADVLNDAFDNWDSGEQVKELLISESIDHILITKDLPDAVARGKEDEEVSKIQPKQEKIHVQVGECPTAGEECETNQSDMIGPLYNERNGTQATSIPIQPLPAHLHKPSLWVFFLTAITALLSYWITY
ncbi:hypothetical protein ABOM_001957 [Aspergillus bombycis]|uniref:NACHT domain-containing protein n=1 Tax=Aspergillus bombycis TaxID=109264 RepID=A0A1F8AB37_9EURO|nr:hypothetical protein ABOM_001957 [Aspergillus bombycis]OGM48619.1 hypothetical protein ABOM_001957 [Aspergillus bombycis]